jgi:AbrB family looped-hinge helix DNA binding protein
MAAMAGEDRRALAEGRQLRARGQACRALGGFFQMCGSVRAMRTTIDKAGRLVIPRSLRDRIGMADGGEVEIELDGAAIRIAPVAGSDLREEAGLLVIPSTGTPITAADVRELIDADRHQR